ncbi:MAG: hypothetical protein WCO69_01515 [Candidatus Omnitrophota bacterium]
MAEKKNGKKPVKKGFWAGLVDAVDRKMESMVSCGGGCNCSGGDKKNSKCC